MPKIYFSVIIPTYNRAELIRKVIGSALRQTYELFELIIVDDGSTDNTADVVGQYKDERVHYYRKENGERGAARNFGSALAKGDYLNFFDSDDCMYPNHLATARQMIEQYISPEVFHVNFELINEQGHLVSPARQFTGSVADYLILSNDLACNSVFVRRDIALKHPFNEDRALSTAEDWELWLRLAARYPFYGSSTITHAQVAHTGRSLAKIGPERIIQRDERLLVLLLEDQPFREKFSTCLPRFIADRYTFITLNLALTTNRRMATLRFLWKAIKADPSVIVRKRFLASIKHWVSGTSAC